MVSAERTLTTFAIELRRGHDRWYLGKASNDWAILSGAKLVLEDYEWRGEHYIKIPNEESYMSVSDNAEVGFYGWSDATTFHEEGGKLISDYNNQALSFYTADYKYLYCWDSYNVLEVNFVAP